MYVAVECKYCGFGILAVSCVVYLIVERSWALHMQKGKGLGTNSQI